MEGGTGNTVNHGDDLQKWSSKMLVLMQNGGRERFQKEVMTRSQS